MENSALRYKLYRILLESDLSNDQRDFILESWFDNLKAWLGAAKDVGQTNIGKMFADKKYSRRIKVAADNITKEIQGLRDVAKDAGRSDEEVYEMLNAILSGAGAEPEKIEKAAESPSTPETDSKGSAEGQVAPGAPVQFNPSSVSTLVKAAAQASGQDPEEVAAKAEEKKIDAQKATEALAKAISIISKVEAGKVLKIVNFLIKNKHMVVEGRAVKTADLRKAVNEILKIKNDYLLIERWSAISGIPLLEQEAVPEEVKKKFIDLKSDIRDSFDEKELSDDDILGVLWRLDDLESIELK